MRRFTPPREFYIPAGAVKVVDKQSGAVAYLYDNSAGQPCARVFVGKQAKPIMAYRFRNSAEREKSVRSTFEGARASIAAKTEQRAKRTAENKLELGDILSTCWGYDQTNREFFEVVEVAGKYVTVREIAQVREQSDWAAGRCVPQSGAFIGKPLRKLVQYGDSVKIDESRTANKWNTSKVAGVAIGPALNWTAYH